MQTQISIRSLQHFLYCPHRWGLLEIGRAWAENYFVARANLLHSRVHEEGAHTLRGRRIFTGVHVFDDERGLYGVLDALEADERGYVVVEYKPSAPKDGAYRHEDAMQVFAQKVCVDSALGGDCAGEIYYANEKRRVKLPLKEEYFKFEAQLNQILSQMRSLLNEGVIPPAEKSQKCAGCSLKDICMPRPAKCVAKSVKSRVEEILCENF